MSALAEQWDALTTHDLEARGSIKWTRFPGTIGAWVAEMDFGIAPPIAQAIRATADTLETGYMPNGLALDLGDASASFLKRRFGWSVEPEHVGLLGDVLRAYELAFTYWRKPDQPIVLPTPAYPPFMSLPALQRIEVIQVPCLRDEDGVWRLDDAGIEAALSERGGLLVLCSPHNPLGRLYTRAELERVAAIATRTGARVFADEIHAPLNYGGAHLPYASLNADTAAHAITAISASKAWNIPGLACAQMVFSNAADAEKFTSLGHHVTRGASNVGARASIAAYLDGDEWLGEVTSYLDGNRQHLAQRLERDLPGALHRIPEATYLAWIDVSQLTNRRDLAPMLREEAKVAVTGGEDCGLGGAGAFRLNLATPRPVLDEALDRIFGVLRKGA
ncbi:cystathione beta-lyase [Devosia lucknowensis]|uniref:cysteine-S-conjugate beta-lyase n=1 Tax=Devosia lucknowensis TaxID=1096929 RepID=A0A1Y6G5Q8_9HYPH|nr:aminotransferase class I/II-fold pyridoxal phosphate-dependent enzyme [Devosia lucknowensis]SMQ85465.1 cystathione beta-lyase [Devosia lucknowensis]